MARLPAVQLKHDGQVLSLSLLWGLTTNLLMITDRTPAVCNDVELLR